MVSIVGVSEKVLNNLNHYVFDKLHLAYVYIDHGLIVKELSNNWHDYGFEKFNVGDDVSSFIDFFVGVDTSQSLNLPIVETPTGQSVSVTMIPDEDGMTVTVLDAGAQKQYRSRLQQAANENELLVEQQKRLMAQLEQASDELSDKNQQLNEANRLQSSFLSGVSHEFRTPLTSIIGYTDRIQKNLKEFLTAESSKFSADDLSFFTQNLDFLNSTNRSSQHMLSLVENLLDHGKFDSNEIVVRPRAINLKEIFNDVDILMRPLCEPKNIDLVIDLESQDSLSVFIDDSRLRQCLINLVGNAVKFTDHGSVTVRGIWKAEQLTVVIEDTGLGISTDDLAKIKLPFWQAQGTGKAGTGLGLTITEKIIDLMGGNLSISSVFGEGTSVKFDLLAPKVDAQQQTESRVSLNKPLKVLLAEDDTDIADLLIMMLQDKGVEVSHAINGAIALDMVDEESFDLILMDLNMPIMTGYQAIERLRDRGIKTPIVVMSASALEDSSHPVGKIDCDAYIVKPVGVDNILRIANQLVT